MTPTVVPQNRRRWLAVKILLLSPVSIIFWRLLLTFFSSAPQVGLVEGNLRSCPNKPNCVCSTATDELHQIAPLRLSGSASEQWERLLEVIRGLPRTRIVTRDDRYMHVEFTTALMRFVDDVEFLLDEPAGIIHVRSASRIGHSDLGTNRKRIEDVRKLFCS